MSDHNSTERVLREHIDSHEHGRALPRPFYTDELIYRAEMDRIWRRGWLFAGFGCEIPGAGDYFTFEFDDDSLIIIRDDDGTVRAFYNVCRHRGTALVDDCSGCVESIVCPYHQWTYARDGSLMGFRGMQDGIDKSQLGLHRAQLEEVDGLIFVSLCDTPPDFQPCYDLIAPAVRAQGFGRAKVAKILEYEIHANWKLIWDNNRECFHCNVNHPQYIKANFDHYNADDTNDRVRATIDAAVAKSEEKWSAANLQVTHTDTGIAPFPESGTWFSANRTTLAPGFTTESMNGAQVAPLMGDYVEPEVGTLRLRTLPNFWCHASCDHVVSARLLPGGRGLTKARSTWLVHEDAVEGVDYHLDDLLPFWQLTNEQDWELCARAQRGILSSRYTPGPLSTYKEYNVDGFHKWVLGELQRPWCANVEPVLLLEPSGLLITSSGGTNRLHAMLYERLAGLGLEISDYRLEGLVSTTSGGWDRRTTVVHLSGAGHSGAGEDISYEPEDQLAFQNHAQALRVPGTYTVESFSRHLDSLPLFAEPPRSPANPLYRRWGFESAALDLALKQVGKPLHAVLDRSPRPVKYVVSLGLGDPTSDERLRRIHELYPGTGFKVDLAENWTDATIDLLNAIGTVSTVDLKGQYHGNFTGAPADAKMYRAVAERMPQVWIEDPAWSGPAWDALEDHRERITWDAILHSVSDIVQLPVPPKCVNIKPSRFGFLSELMRVYEYCESQGIAMYGGGQFELGVGRGHIQYLASMFHPDGDNDVAPGGFNIQDLPGDLKATPLEPQVSEIGFEWAATV